MPAAATHACLKQLSLFIDQLCEDHSASRHLVMQLCLPACNGVGKSSHIGLFFFKKKNVNWSFRFSGSN